MPILAKPILLWTSVAYLAVVVAIGVWAMRRTRNAKDAARRQVAKLLEKQGDFQGALNHLVAIDPHGSIAGARKRIPILEKKLQEQLNKKKMESKKE